LFSNRPKQTKIWIYFFVKSGSKASFVPQIFDFLNYVFLGRVSSPKALAVSENYSAKFQL
jgi:hypothetical protein